jgi:hypothetical protein
MLCATFAFLARSAAAQKCATFDEPLALVSAWVQTHDLDFRVGPENPPLYKYIIGLSLYGLDLRIDRGSPAWNRMLTDMNSNIWFVSDVLWRRPQHDVDRLLNHARSCMIALAVVLGIIIAWWAWRLRGPAAAVVALALFCFDPNILAHAPLLKNDLPLALVFTTLMAGIWLLGERATVVRWAGVSLLLGAALTTKFSGVFGIPVLGAALLLRAIIPTPWTWFAGLAKTRISRFGVACLLFAGVLVGAYVVVWAVYGFRFEISSDPGHVFDPAAINRAVNPPQGLAEATSVPSIQALPPNPLLGPAQWALRHKLLPEGWIAGFVFIQNFSRSRPAFLWGQRSTSGWWYYFPLVMLFKTPIASLSGSALAIGYMAWKFRILATDAKYLWPIAAFSILPVTYMCIAMTTNYDVGIRHLFPVYPFLFIGIGVAAADAWRRRPRLTASLVSLLLAGLILETICSYPNFIPFFNVLAGGSRGGLSLLSDSNLDWGQDLPLLEQWQKDHPDRNIVLIYFGAADPAYYGIRYYTTGTRTTLANPEQISQMHPVYAVSATILQGTYLSPADYAQTQPFRQAKPFEILGGSICLFDRP